jgi:type II secretory pathway predicted ATPase ExeA
VSGPDVSHLHPEVRPLAMLDDESRIARIRTERWIAHATAIGILESLQEAFTQPRSERMENVLLIAESGMGKTSLIRKFERNNIRACYPASGITPRPVVVMLMPQEPNEDAFFVQLLKAVAAPFDLSARRHRLALRETTFRVLRELETRVLVIDEINSLLVGTARQQRLFLQLLRFLSNELRIALVCTGVPEARHALLSDPQLRSRFYDIELPPWKASSELQAFINLLVQGLPLRRPSPVDSARLRRLLAERSGGITLVICRALERAGVVAIRSGQECIDLAMLEDPDIWRGMRARPAPGAGANDRAGAQSGVRVIGGQASHHAAATA